MLGGGIWGLATHPTDDLLYAGHVVACTQSVRIVYTAVAQSIPVQPPIPAFNISASILSVKARSFVPKRCTDKMDVKSSSSCWKRIRRCNIMLIPGTFFSALRHARCRCFCSLAVVSSLFRLSRVVIMRTRISDWGRVRRNSSMRRQQIAKPSPLDFDPRQYWVFRVVWNCIRPVRAGHQCAESILAVKAGNVHYEGVAYIVKGRECGSCTLTQAGTCDPPSPSNYLRQTESSPSNSHKGHVSGSDGVGDDHSRICIAAQLVVSIFS